VGARVPLPIAVVSRRAAADPFPARVVVDAELHRFADAGAGPVADAAASPSPLPPEGFMD
jgi:hypothetical protein